MASLPPSPTTLPWVRPLVALHCAVLALRVTTSVVVSVISVSFISFMTFLSAYHAKISNAVLLRVTQGSLFFQRCKAV